MRIHSSIVSLIQVAFRFLCVGWIYFSGLFWWSFWKAFHFSLFIKREMEPLANANIILKRKFNFKYAFQPLYYFSRFVGLWPFSIIHDSKGTIQKAHIGPFNILTSILIVCLNLAQSLDSYRNLKVELAKYKVRIRFTVFIVFKISFSLFTIIRISMDLINSNELVDILKKFNAFDNEVRFIFPI